MRMMLSAIQALAPLLASALASDSEQAVTKKLDQPNPFSKSRQEMTPIPGISSRTRAMIAGRAGFQWWSESVSHKSDAPRVMTSVRISLPESGRGSVRGMHGRGVLNPPRWRT